MKAAGFGLLFCNIGDYPASEWESVRNGARSAGVVCGPWLRTQNAHGDFDAGRLDMLIETSEYWGDAPFVVNAEKELDFTGDDITAYIADQIEGYEAAISMEVRPFGTVDWTPLADYPVLPQNFPAETGIGDTDDMIRQNWWNAGIHCVVITYGSYRGMTPAQFERKSPYGVYTADDCGNNFMPWASAGTCTPCNGSFTPPDGGDLMEKIGSQHGVSGFIEWLRSQPDVPPRKPAYNENDLSTWPWVDKLERTLNILVKDHDAQA